VRTILAGICEYLKKGRTLAMVTIAAEKGSTPRSAGSKMLIDAGGLLCGTIGGGLAEARAIKEAGEVLASGKSSLLHADMSGCLAEGADLICGGRMDIFIQTLKPELLDFFQMLLARYEHGQNTLLVTSTGESAPVSAVFPDGSVAGAALAPERSSVIMQKAPESAILMQVEGENYLVESLLAPLRLILAGGGHVSQAVCRVAVPVGFKVTVLDDRPEFVAQERFPQVAADCLLTVPAFIDSLDEKKLGFPVDERCFIAILTRGHVFDASVLYQSLKTKAGYIGMIGSRAKKKQLYAKLMKMGFTQEDLMRPFCPIGIKIGAETPAEIAVSIVSELIARRAEILRNKPGAYTVIPIPN
jgi:xanthine dehydrogenase accessory factor